MSRRYNIDRGFRTLLVLVFSAAWDPHDAAGQATLDPGQLTGPVRIGTRDIISGGFRATSTSFGSTANLNGTLWNGTDFTGPLDPFGYTVSVQAIDPDTNTNVPYDVEASDVRTSSGLGDVDVTRFPKVLDVTVNPGGTPGDVALAAFDEPNPWILDAELVNIGPCPRTHFASLRVEANAHLHANDWAQTYSDDSQGDVDGAGLTFRRHLDMPLLPGAGAANVYDLRATTYVNTTGNPADGAPILLTSDVTVGPSDVVVDGMGIPRIHVVFELDFDCQCPLSSVSGTIALAGLTPAEQSSVIHYVGATGPSQKTTSVTSNPAPYTISGNLQPGRYSMSAGTFFGNQNNTLRWPLSTHRDYDGLYYEDVACNQDGTYSFEGNAAFIEGKISYTCQAQFEPALVQTYDIWNYGMLEGVDSNGAYIGSFGGESRNARDADDGDYRMVATEGSWNTYFHRAIMRSTNYSCCGANPTTAAFIWEDLNITENRFKAVDPSDAAAIHVNAGDVFRRDFSYEMAKLTVTYTIAGATPAETLLRDPGISVVAGGATDPLTSEPLYTVEMNALGTSEQVQVGTVTFFLPKGDYSLRPYATRVLDGSTATFPVLDVSIQGCVDVSCSVSCPSVDWTPRADTCGSELGEVEGTASDSDGWHHIAYRVNHVPPGADTTDGYLPFTLVPTGGPDDEVTFTASLTLQPGANDVELEAVDGAGNRYYEHRTTYRSTGALPVLTWTAPADGSITDDSTTLVEGEVSASVKIDAVTVNGVAATLSPDPGSSDPHDRLFSYTLPLALGANEIVVHVVDVCGAEVEEIRSVTRVLPQPTATPTATFTPSVSMTPPATTTATPTPSTTATPIPGALDHFQCHETHRSRITHAPLALVDAFGASTARLKRAKRICAPADKNGEDPTAPTHPGFLTAYTIKQTSAFQRVSDLAVTNQFGTVTLDAVKPDRLLVPTALSLVGPPVPLAAPADHFKCYRVTGARSPRAHVPVTTIFGAGLVDVKKPLHLCVPVDKNGEGIVDPAAHLLCYRVRTPVPNIPGAAATLNQFGPDTFAVFGARELCVPSTVQP